MHDHASILKLWIILRIKNLLMKHLPPKYKMFVSGFSPCHKYYSSCFSPSCSITSFHQQPIFLIDFKQYFGNLHFRKYVKWTLEKGNTLLRFINIEY